MPLGRRKDKILTTAEGFAEHESSVRKATTGK
jgi:hypothetical protein